MTGLRAVVVDDEPLAREGLVAMLAAHPDVTVAGVFPGGAAALAGLPGARADVLFVDIRMPGMSGLQLAASLDLEPPPAIVFVTAYDAHAIRAFELNAIDYLLKPLETGRLALTLDRVRQRVRQRHHAGDQARLETVIRQLDPERGAGRLIVREVGQITVIATRDVDWIEGADYYARLHTGAAVHLLRETLTSLERRLDPRRFFRLHRSAIVNLTRVKSVEAHQRGDAIVVLADGTRLKVTSARRGELERRLERLHESR